MGKTLDLSIVMPCLDEEETLGRCIEKAKRFLSKHSSISGEIIVSDNGSEDGSREIAKKAGVEIIHATGKGYGSALIQGIRKSRGRYIIIGDADDSYDFSDLNGFLEKLHQGYDLVMGCRMPSGGGVIEKGAMPVLHRYIGNPLLSTMGKIFFKAPVHDFHCGFRGMTRTAFDAMQLQTVGMEFATEMVIKAKLIGLKITEIPITFYSDGRSRKPHLNPWKDGWRHFRLMFLYCPKALFYFPGIILSLFGFFGMLVMHYFNQVEIYNVIFSLNSLLVLNLSFLSGIQLIFFGLIAELLARKTGLIPGESSHPALPFGLKVKTLYFVGIIFFATGSLFLGYYVLLWASGGFTIDFEIYQATTKNMITCISLVLLGLQVVFWSFILDMLQLIESEGTHHL